MTPERLREIRTLLMRLGVELTAAARERGPNCYAHRYTAALMLAAQDVESAMAFVVDAENAAELEARSMPRKVGP